MYPSSLQDNAITYVWRLIEPLCALQNCLEREPLPAGYVFVPKGDVYITRHCRSETKDSQQMVYVVYVRSQSFLPTEKVELIIPEQSRETHSRHPRTIRYLHLRPARRRRNRRLPRQCRPTPRCKRTFALSTTPPRPVPADAG